MAYGEIKARQRPKCFYNGQSAGKSLHFLFHINKRGLAFWESQLETLNDLYWNQGLSSTQIGKIYNVWPETITFWMRKLGIPRRVIGSNSRPNALYTIDSSFFDKIDTEEKAYVLGFLLSDGHISKANVLMFGVKKTDEDVLFKIREALKSTHPIKYKSEHMMGDYVCAPSAQYNAQSKIIADRLHQMGIYHDKTKSLDINTVLPFVQSEYEWAFIRGLFDGDGSICIYNYDYFKKHTYHIGFTGLKKTCDYIQTKFGLATKMQDEGNGIYTVRSTCRSDIVRIGHLLYDDATIYMNRKKETFERVYALASIE